MRFVELFLRAADGVGWPDDERTRTALPRHLEFGTAAAVQDSFATSDADLHPCQEVPRRQWCGPELVGRDQARPGTMTP